MIPRRCCICTNELNCSVQLVHLVLVLDSFELIVMSESQFSCYTYLLSNFFDIYIGILATTQTAIYILLRTKDCTLFIVSSKIFITWLVFLVCTKIPVNPLINLEYQMVLQVNQGIQIEVCKVDTLQTSI